MTLVEFGAKLHALRKEQKLTLQDVTEKIKIASRLIENIENGNREALPHTVYTKGFITSYATLLGIDQEELLQDLHSIFDCELTEESHVLSSPLGKNKVKTGTFKRICISLLFFAILAGVLAVWQGERYKIPSVDLLGLIKKPFVAVTNNPVPHSSAENKVESIGDKQPSVEKKQTSVENEPEGAKDTTGADSKEAKDVTQDSDTSASASHGSQEAITPTAIVTPTEEEQSAAVTSTKYKHIVHIDVAREQCWIGSETDGGEQKSEMLNAGESKDYPYNQSIRIILGNPSTVTLVHDGVPYGRKFNGSRREILQFP